MFSIEITINTQSTYALINKNVFPNISFLFSLITFKEKNNVKIPDKPMAILEIVVIDNSEK